MEDGARSEMVGEISHNVCDFSFRFLHRKLILSHWGVYKLGLYHPVKPQTLKCTTGKSPRFEGYSTSEKGVRGRLFEIKTINNLRTPDSLKNKVMSLELGVFYLYPEIICQV